jgi:hypothetical protein
MKTKPPETLQELRQRAADITLVMADVGMPVIGWL